MTISGKWWLSFGEQTFDTDEVRWIEFADGKAVDSDGDQISYRIDDSMLQIDLPDSEGSEVVFHTAFRWGDAFPPIDEKTIWLAADLDAHALVLAKDGEWAEKLTQANRARAECRERFKMPAL